MFQTQPDHVQDAQSGHKAEDTQKDDIETGKGHSDKRRKRRDSDPQYVPSTKAIVLQSSGEHTAAEVGVPLSTDTHCHMTKCCMAICGKLVGDCNPLVNCGMHRHCIFRSGLLVVGECCSDVSEGAPGPRQARW